MSGKDVKSPGKKSPSKLSVASNVLREFYNDPFKWNLAKSVVFFGFGVYLARDLASVNFFEGQ